MSSIFDKSYNRSIIDYGSTLYGSANNTLLKRIDSIQSKALRICYGAMRSTPIETLRVENREPPLALRRAFLGAKQLLKIRANQQKYILDKITQLTTLDLTSNYWRSKPSPHFPIVWFPKNSTSPKHRL